LRVAIVGEPNVGKSSLLNALLGAERAIVTARPGTTRDVLEDCVDFDGVPVVLYDTAGLRETADEVERIGVDRARQVAAGADLVLVVLDTARPLASQRALLAAGQPIAVLNKIDLATAWSAAERADIEHRFRGVPVSATVPIGLDALRLAVVARQRAVERQPSDPDQRATARCAGQGRDEPGACRHSAVRRPTARSHRRRPAGRAGAPRRRHRPHHERGRPRRRLRRVLHRQVAMRLVTSRPSA
jgi:small GTP-binding protein